MPYPSIFREAAKAAASPLFIEVTGTIGFVDSETTPFLYIHVDSIGGKKITGNAELFNAIKPRLPTLTATHKNMGYDITHHLSATVNPVRDEADRDKAHISVLYKFAFAQDTPTREAQFKRARKQAGKKISLALDLDKFNLITAAPALKKAKLESSAGTHKKVESLGTTRNTLMTADLDPVAQEEILGIARNVLGNQEFEGNTDRSGKTVTPYHLTLAQAQLAEDIFKQSRAPHP